MARKWGNKWVQDKVLVLPNKEDCYVYKRPRSNIWQYYLVVPNEGEERKTTGVKGDPDDITVGQKEAIDFALNRKLEVMARHQQGLKAIRVKKMFDFIDEFLKEEKKRIASHNIKGNITLETFRIKKHHLNLLKKYYKNKNTKLEDLDYPKLYNYPLWRQKTTDDNSDPIPIKPPKTTHTILAELTTIKGYFAFLERKGFISKFPNFHKLTRESSRVNRRDYLNPRQYQQTINTVRAWSNSSSCTTSQTYNRKVMYQMIIIMANSCLRIGELRGLLWKDLEPNDNLSKEDQKIGHLIKIRAEITKVGTPRSVQSPTTTRFDALRQLAGIPKVPKSRWPHIPLEYRNCPVVSKYRHPDKPFGQGTVTRGWADIRDLCAERYWNEKNISWYSCRHTGISFAVARGVPMLQLARNAGTGIRYIEDVYYHHEAESKSTWDTLNTNRRFIEHMKHRINEPLISIDQALEGIDLDET